MSGREEMGKDVMRRGFSSSSDVYIRVQVGYSRLRGGELIFYLV